MLIRFFGPFKGFDKELELDIDGCIILRDLVSQIAEQAPGFSKYVAMETDAELSAHISFIQGGRQLRLDDTVENDKRIDIVLPVIGG